MTGNWYDLSKLPKGSHTFTMRHKVEGRPTIPGTPGIPWDFIEEPETYQQAIGLDDNLNIVYIDKPIPKTPEAAVTKTPKDITEIPTQTRAISWNRQWLTVKELRAFLNQIPDQALIEVVGSQGDTGRIVATWETPT